MSANDNGLGLERLDRSKLYPPFLELVVEALKAEAAAGRRYVATSGYRPSSEQAALYARGRTVPGYVVTNSPPGHSYHEFGLAIDFARDADPDKPGLQPDWTRAGLKPLADAAVATKGLEAGYYFKTIVDAPHVQLKMPQGITLADFRKFGDDLKAVFAYLDGRFGRVAA